MIKTYLPVLILLLQLPLFGSEGGIGRYFPGTYAGVQAAILAPEGPGLYLTDVSTYYVGRERTFQLSPTGDLVRVIAKGESYENELGFVYVPKIDWKNVYFGFGAAVPFTTVRAHLRFPDLHTDKTDKSGWTFGDIFFHPFLLELDYHPHYFLATVRIYTPSAWFHKTNAASPGSHFWTYVPALAYTYFKKEEGLDFSVYAGIDLNTKNHATQYTSGAMAHIDVTINQSFKNGFGIGITGSWMQQITNDTGTLAKLLHGYKGRALGIGPDLTYSYRNGNFGLDFELIWEHEFNTHNRIHGNNIFFNINAKL